MTERGATPTVWSGALLRAIHQLKDESPKILDDSIVVKLLKPSLLNHLHTEGDQVNTPPMLALRSHLILRSRYAEDRLAEAVRRRIRL